MDHKIEFSVKIDRLLIENVKNAVNIDGSKV